jgi:hypothetical protein
MHCSSLERGGGGSLFRNASHALATIFQYILKNICWILFRAATPLIKLGEEFSSIEGYKSRFQVNSISPSAWLLNERCEVKKWREELLLHQIFFRISIVFPPHLPPPPPLSIATQLFALLRSSPGKTSGHSRAWPFDSEVTVSQNCCWIWVYYIVLSLLLKFAHASIFFKSSRFLPFFRSGDVYFGKEVTLKGTVVIMAHEVDFVFPTSPLQHFFLGGFIVYCFPFRPFVIDFTPVKKNIGILYWDSGRINTAQQSGCRCLNFEISYYCTHPSRTHIPLYIPSNFIKPCLPRKYQGNLRILDH